MLQDSDRLKLLVERLLELTKAENITSSNETSNLSDILTKLTDKFSSQGMDIEIKSQCNYQINISGEILETALSNLMTNSLQHDATRVELDIRKNNREVVLDMKDNGRGIPPGNRDKVFTPFFTTHRESGGTGLGLRIVQTLIESHSGKISLGETESGTLFTLQLPSI